MRRPPIVNKGGFFSFSVGERGCSRWRQCIALCLVSILAVMVVF